MIAEKDPSWHGEQSASDDHVAPAHSTHEFLASIISTQEFTFDLRPARRLCLSPSSRVWYVCRVHVLVIPAMPYDPVEQGDPLHAHAPAER